jgi:hypothetical protein
MKKAGKLGDEGKSVGMGKEVRCGLITSFSLGWSMEGRIIIRRHESMSDYKNFLLRCVIR